MPYRSCSAAASSRASRCPATRARHVRLTAAGWRYYNDLVPEMKRQEETLRTVLKAGKLEMLYAVLERFDAFFAAKGGA